VRQIERAEIVQFLSNFSNRIYMLHNEKVYVLKQL